MRTFHYPSSDRLLSSYLDSIKLSHSIKTLLAWMIWFCELLYCLSLLIVELFCWAPLLLCISIKTNEAQIRQFISTFAPIVFCSTFYCLDLCFRYNQDNSTALYTVNWRHNLAWMFSQIIKIKQARFSQQLNKLWHAILILPKSFLDSCLMD